MGISPKTSKPERNVRGTSCRNLLCREATLGKSLPEKMADEATDKQLKQVFLTHLDETKPHVQPPRAGVPDARSRRGHKAGRLSGDDGIIEESREVARAKVADIKGRARFAQLSTPAQAAGNITEITRLWQF